MELKDKIEKAIEEELESSNFELITEIKLALNSVYGEQRNQIIKPNYETILNLAKSTGMQDDFMSNLRSYIGIPQIRAYIKSFDNKMFNYQIIIHFPEITITNEKLSHLIRDMYVRLFFRPNCTFFPRIQGMRTTLSEKEFLSHYIHSHLPGLSSSIIEFNDFCTGIGEINQVLALLNTRYRSADFMMLLMHIKNFLEWESKEGRPYMYIENIFSRTGVSLPNINGGILDKIVNLLISTMKAKFDPDGLMKMFTFEVTQREIEVNPTLDLEKWIAKEIRSWDLRSLLNIGTSDHFLSFRDNEGTYHRVTSDSLPAISHQKGTILKFKDKNIEFQVIERSQKNNNEEKFAHPQITKKTCEELSRKLTEATFTTPGIKSGGSINCNSESTEADKLSMSGSVDRGVVWDAVL